MAKVMPAGTKRFGIASESCPVFMPLSGNAFANVFNVIVAMNPKTASTPSAR
jgi:hypothetical protein